MTKKVRFPGGSDGKESACYEGDLGLIPGLGRSPGGGQGKPIPVFLPGESPWTEEPGGYSPRGRKELDTIERLSTAQHADASLIIGVSQFTIKATVWHIITMLL